METTPTYRGWVLILYGDLAGYNGLMKDCVVDYDNGIWKGLIEVYLDGDLYAIPLEALEPIELAGRIC